MSPTVDAYVGLGSNLGESVATLRAALTALDAISGTHLVRASHFYRTPAWGVTEQPDFLNAVAMVRTQLPAAELLAAMLDIERAAGRNRSADGSDRWGPRTLDLDLLLYGDAVVDVPGLHVPHPHLHERAFALVPLVEIAPDTVIPGVGRARDALARMETADIEALTYTDPPADA
ncbi:2-amino-4-hydroxy-6-hydroxymethyldihydropteridine diphosphokinase [Lysobacter niastensis]|uniref:2-amino-4-hydroxy-6-hydroxymethyldihydropteridine pyrophosphokinase n=1 Tax=Lysobacter niastensis TaxID=380629 RepID=A0ABS0B5X2_9GAMM|nr:2-amino-4-hydroxy-6-hydroxymethyldihydropteridine diphosphokinase [Lysobacter niastensis]MBF6024341.1 2-amino-4-hydroxy-6-hydroxymethyldihydropteridine diphosphokinase [Lysobacter niastensis]